MAYKHANVNDVITALEQIADDRDECYTLTCTHKSHDGTNGSMAGGGNYTDNSITNVFRTSSAIGQELFIDSIPADMIPYCGLISRRDDAGPVDNYVVDVCQTPAYFMQHLAILASGDIMAFITQNMAPRYEAAKNAMRIAKTNGIDKPHLPITYYLLSTHISGSSFNQ